MRKLVSVEALIAVLQTLPKDMQIGARTLANTGNLTLHDSNGRQVGYIDLMSLTVEMHDA